MELPAKLPNKIDYLRQSNANNIKLQIGSFAGSSIYSKRRVHVNSLFVTNEVLKETLINCRGAGNFFSVFGSVPKILQFLGDVIVHAHFHPL